MWGDTLHGPCLTTLSGYLDIQKDSGYTMLIILLSRELKNYQLVGTCNSLQSLKQMLWCQKNMSTASSTRQTQLDRFCQIPIISMASITFDFCSVLPCQSRIINEERERDWMIWENIPDKISDSWISKSFYRWKSIFFDFEI